MKTVIEKIVKAQDRLNIAMSLIHLKETRERNGLWNEEDKNEIAKKIIDKLIEARDTMETAIIEVAGWQ
ncbi:MAG: hypothetical protein KHZ87_05670 [Clostridiales bacterium]|nr:hypothetical protein [Clostridiales bacterium]MBS5877263.1 hypothetical protein [Clostridiales bacterium]